MDSGTRNSWKVYRYTHPISMIINPIMRAMLAVGACFAAVIAANAAIAASFEPDRFLWGVATAAYQTEGELTKDGRGKSIWDDFATPMNRNISDSGTNGEVADLSYDLFVEGTDNLIIRLFPHLLMCYRYCIDERNGSK